MPNDMKYKLRELIDQAETKWWLNVLNEEPPSEFIADYLIENGVILPPCKVGDTVYIVCEVSKKIADCVVMGCWMFEDNCTIITNYGSIHNNSFGKTVFLTKEEAEEKLKECSNNGC